MPKRSLTSADIDALKGVFATKEDLNNFATKEDVRSIVKDELQSFPTYDDLKNELAPIKKDIRQIKKDVNLTLKYVDDQDKVLRKRVVRLEEHAGLPPLLD